MAERRYNKPDRPTDTRYPLLPDTHLELRNNAITCYPGRHETSQKAQDPPRLQRMRPVVHGQNDTSRILLRLVSVEILG